jgi:hypothetical protein
LAAGAELDAAFGADDFGADDFADGICWLLEDDIFKNAVENAQRAGDEEEQDADKNVGHALGPKWLRTDGKVRTSPRGAP